MIETHKTFFDITPAISKSIRGKDVSEPEKYEINKQEKKNLCDWLCDNGSAQDFKNFDLIFKIIEEAIDISPTDSSHESPDSSVSDEK